MKSIILTKQDLAICERFANQVINSHSDHYKKRRQYNPTKIKHDIIIGKLGELGVYKMLQRSNYKVTPPDFEIYESPKKTFDADLDCAGKPLHVKSQDLISVKRYGMSWIFQYSGSGKGHTDPIFSDQNVIDNDMAAFVTVDLDNLKVTGYYLNTIKFLHDNNLFLEPRLCKLRGIKKVVYWNQLEKAMRKHWGSM